jgi:vacuolar-type H+-ATPase subunit C/Vma6
LYQNLIAISKKNKVLSMIVSNKIDSENLSVCLRAKTLFEFESQLLCGGNIKKQVLTMLFNKKLSALDYINNAHIKKMAKIVFEGSDYAKFEKLRNNLELNLLNELKYDIESISPFAYYVYRKITDIKNVRLILSYQENNLKDKIKNKLLGV